MNSNKTSKELLDQSLSLFNEPSPEDIDGMATRVRGLLKSEAATLRRDVVIASTPDQKIRRPLRFFAVAVTGGCIAVIVASLIWHKSSFSTPVRVSKDQIASRQVIRSDDPSGTTLVLPDESRVEMRVHTELSFERAADGLRVVLDKGSILVNAAKQRTGHLYVQTRDMTVSVVGTVFLVNVEQHGSRVAVIEGEVRVQNGSATERLLPREQIATSSRMAARPVVEEISWSRHAAEHFALLQQSNVASAAASSSADRFDVVSVRPSQQPSGPGARGGGGGGLSLPLPCPTANVYEMNLVTQLDPGRLAMKFQSLYALIALAYGHSCPAPNTITGGMDWMRNEYFDFEATIPAGTPGYTKEQLYSGNAPRLQRMLQNLLAERFTLVLKREIKETEGYNLVVAQSGKLKVSADQTADQAPPAPNGRGLLGGSPAIPSIGAPISRLISMIQRTMDRPIADKTDLTGLYDVWLEFPEVSLPEPPPAGATNSEIQHSINQTQSRIRELLPGKLEATTGLKLVPAKVPVQVLIIVSAERPMAN